MVHLWAGAAAVEPRDYLARDHYHESHAQNAVLDACRAIAEAEGASFESCELYSCFPCVPKMAARRLGLPRGMAPTTTGGLTFFGAPLNNYMTHAAAGMVRALREQAGQRRAAVRPGRVRDQAPCGGAGEPAAAGFPPAAGLLGAGGSRQPPRPGARLRVEAAGEATIETFTVLHDRDGAPHHGVVILRTADGGRTFGRVPGEGGRYDRLAEAPRPYADRHAGAAAPGGRRRAGMAPAVTNPEGEPACPRSLPARSRWSPAPAVASAARSR